jgi:hypothetical protein
MCTRSMALFLDLLALASAGAGPCTLRQRS